MSTVHVPETKAYEHGIVPSTLEHRLQELGDIPANRVLQRWLPSQTYGSARRNAKPLIISDQT